MSDELISPARAPKIHAAIAAVMAEGIWVGKNKQANHDGGYKFRAIDDVIAYLQPLLAKHKITIVQRVIERERETYTTAKGGRAVSTRLLVEHRITCAEDGSSVLCVTLGEANDTSDKSANKCMTAALKYALVHTFMIPTYEPERDTEETSHEPPQEKRGPREVDFPTESKPPPDARSPNGNGKSTRPPAQQAGGPPDTEEVLSVAIDEAQTTEQLKALASRVDTFVRGNRQAPLRLQLAKRYRELAPAPQQRSAS